MNCLEFRRLCLSDPGNRSTDYLVHREQCADCARYAENVGALDQKVGQALRVPVPDDLANRIKLRQLMQDEQVSRRARPWRYALAASVLLAVTLGGVLGYQIHSTNQYIERLSVAAVDHTRVERQGSHFVAAHEDPAKQAQRFKQILAAFGGSAMDDDMAALGPIVHVQVCALAGIAGPVAHVLIHGKAGLISVYYVPGHKLRDQAPFAQGNYAGMLVPVGQGNLAVIGNPGESLELVADKIKQAVVWQI